MGQEAARDLLPSNCNFAEADFAHSEGGYIVGATPFATRAGQRLVMTYVGQVPEVLKSTSTLERFIR